MITNPHHASSPSPWRRIFCSFFLVAAVLAVVVAVSSSDAVGQRVGGNPVNVANKIAPWVFEHTAYGQQAEFFVVLADQADLSPAANWQTKADKGRYVYNTLLNKARSTQEPILRWLREHGLEHRSFYIVNVILVTGTREVAQALAGRPDVARVEGNPHIQNHLPQPEAIDEAPPQSRGPGTP